MILKISLNRNPSLLYASIFPFLLIFIVPVIIYGLDIPYRYDDLNSFILQFDNQYLRGAFIEKLFYFVNVTNHPHPQIGVRLASIISYSTFGKINFYVINVIGALVHSLILFTLIRHKRITQIWQIIVLSTIILVPVASTIFWKISILSNGVIYLTSYCALLFNEKKKLKLALLFMFLCIFSGGTSFVLFLLMPLLSFAKHGNTMFSKTILAFSIICFSLFLLVLLSQQAELHSTNSLSVISKNNMLYTKAKALVVLISQFVYSYLRHNSVIILTFLYTIIAIVSGIYRNLNFWKSGDFYFLAFCFLPLLTASILRFNQFDSYSVDQLLIPRYEVMTHYFAFSVVLFLFRNSQLAAYKYGKFVYMLTFLVFTFIYSCRTIFTLKTLPLVSQVSQNNVINSFRGSSQIHNHQKIKKGLISTLNQKTYRPTDQDEWFIDASKSVCSETRKGYSPISINNCNNIFHLYDFELLKNHILFNLKIETKCSLEVFLELHNDLNNVVYPLNRINKILDSQNNQKTRTGTALSVIELSEKCLAGESYEISLLIKANNHFEYCNLGKKISITHGNY